jgi:hypothetical protein
VWFRKERAKKYGFMGDRIKRTESAIFGVRKMKETITNIVAVGP